MASGEQPVAVRSLAINTIKIYRNCIRKLQEKLSNDEKAEYLDNNGLLIKPLGGTIASRIALIL